MGAEKKNNSTYLRVTFREQAKRYQRLLRWGVDRLFVDNPIASMFCNVRSLLGANENSKASVVLLDLKEQIHGIESQRPIKEAEIKKQQLIKIAALEFQIKTIVNRDRGEGESEHEGTLDQLLSDLKTLELARVAIQNFDWPEAQTQIDKVSQALAEFDSEPKKKNNGEKTEIIETPPETLKPILNTAKVYRDLPKEISVNKHDKTSVIAQLLLATAEKSVIGKLIDAKDLHKYFRIFDGANIESLRIAFVATPETINAELSCFSRKQVTLSYASNQIELIRIPVSRKLTVYFLGIPLGFDKVQIKYRASQFSAFFIDTKGAAENDIAQLSESLPELVALNSNIYIKSRANVQSFRKTRRLDQLKYSTIDNNERRFIEDAAAELDNFSILK